MWDHFEKDEQVEAWTALLDRPRVFVIEDLDIWAVCAQSALHTARELTARAGTPGLVIDAVPPGWDDETLLAESLAAAQAG